eukprot:5525721-Pyramimonas_sp.AAC.1
MRAATRWACAVWGPARVWLALIPKVPPGTLPLPWSARAQWSFDHSADLGGLGRVGRLTLMSGAHREAREVAARKPRLC